MAMLLFVLAISKIPASGGQNLAGVWWFQLLGGDSVDGGAGVKLAGLC